MRLHEHNLIFKDDSFMLSCCTCSYTISAQELARKNKEYLMLGLMARLQRLDLNRLELDEAIELSTLAEMLREGYKRHQLSSPVWLDDGIRSLDRYIADRTRDVMEMELRELAQADAADLTASERRDKRKARREELEAKLNPTKASV